MVPAVRTDRYTMFESVAIVLQLIDEHPESNLAPPPASAERALYYQWSIFAAAEVDPAIMTYFDNALRPLDSMRPPGTQHDAGLAEKGRRDFGVRAAMLSNALSGQDYMIGAEFSGADIIVGHSCFMASFTGLIGDYPVLDDYYRRLTARPAHKRAYAGIGPGGAAA